MLKSIYTGIFLVSLILISCTGHPVLDEVSSIPSEGWKSDDRISYDFPISDTSKAYDIFFHIRNMQHYSYSNIWLLVEITAPNSFVRRDTFEIMLADKNRRDVEDVKNNRRCGERAELVVSVGHPAKQRGQRHQ